MARTLLVSRLPQPFVGSAAVGHMAPDRDPSSESIRACSTRAVGEVLLYAVRIRWLVDSYSAVAVARQAGRAVGFATAARGAVAIAAGELATNIARHAQQGVIRIYAGDRYVKIVAEDHGPGIADVDAALRDGHSRGRQLAADDPHDEGMGCGLGSVRRLMDVLEIQSAPGAGTCVVAIKRLAGGRRD